MAELTWEYMFGRPYDGQLVDLRKKRNAPALAPAITSLRDLLGKAAVQPETAAQAWGKGAVTAHNAGAALDIFYHTKGARTGPYARGLLSLFIQNRSTLQWGSIEHNQMEFSPTGVKPNTDDKEHLNHIHIDWIDYSSVIYSMAYPSFPYIDDQGNPQTKIVGPPGQRMSMSWNAGAKTAAFDNFAKDFDDLNRNFESLKDDLDGLGLKDFQRLYERNPHCAVPTPDWLAGWWNVGWRDKVYYYLFESNCLVKWTNRCPAEVTASAPFPNDKGSLMCMGKKVSIQWVSTGSTEEFEIENLEDKRMTGTWNGSEPLVAYKLS